MRDSEDFSGHFLHLNLLDHLLLKLLENLDGHKWPSLLRKRVYSLWFVHSIYSLLDQSMYTTNNDIYVNLSHMFCTQVTESLNAIFKSEQRILDTTATIELNANPFPYELVFNWVRC